MDALSGLIAWFQANPEVMNAALIIFGGIVVKFWPTETDSAWYQWLMSRVKPKLKVE